MQTCPPRPAAVPNKRRRMRPPTRLDAHRDPEPAGGVPGGHAHHDLAGVPANDHGCWSTRTPRRVSSCCWSGIGAPSITAFVLTAALTDGTGYAGSGGRHPVAGPRPVVSGDPGDSRARLRWLLGGGCRHRRPDRFYPLVPALISGLLAGLLEEFGWSGFAFPALQDRFGFLAAGAAVGVIVAVWHLPFFLLPGTTQNASSFAMFLAILVAARIVFGWVYNGSGGSILLAILLHASGNAWTETLGTGPDTADAAGLTKIGVFAVAALAAVWLTRRRASRLEDTGHDASDRCRRGDTPSGALRRAPGPDWRPRRRPRDRDPRHAGHQHLDLHRSRRDHRLSRTAAAEPDRRSRAGRADHRPAAGQRQVPRHAHADVRGRPGTAAPVGTTSRPAVARPLSLAGESCCSWTDCCTTCWSWSSTS